MDGTQVTVRLTLASQVGHLLPDGQLLQQWNEAGLRPGRKWRKGNPGAAGRPSGMVTSQSRRDWRGSG